MSELISSIKDPRVELAKNLEQIKWAKKAGVTIDSIFAMQALPDQTLSGCICFRISVGRDPQENKRHKVYHTLYCSSLNPTS